MNKVPSIKLLIPFALGILLSNYVEIKPLYSFVLFTAFLLASLILFFAKFEKLFFLCSLCALFSAGILVLDVKEITLPNHISVFNDVPSLVSIEGVIKSPADVRPQFVKYTIDVDTIWVDFRPYYTTGKCLVSVWDKNIHLQYGDRILAKGRLTAPPDSRNPGEFDYQKHLAAQEIFCMMNVFSGSSIAMVNRGEGNWLAREIVYPVRKYFVRMVDAAIPYEQGTLLKGLLVGASGEIDYELRQAFANVGVVHVLAVSGLHVGFVLLGLMFVLQLLNIPDPYKSIIILFGLYFYAHLTGFHAPVVRASIMAGILVLGRVFKRKAQPLNSISLAGFVILALNPLELFQVGFQLSFCAVTGIILIYEKLYGLFKSSFFSWEETGNRFQSNLLILFFVSLAAQLATLPLTIYYFGRIPILSLLANVVVVPFVGIIVGLGFIAILSGLLWFPMGIGFATTNGVLLKVLITIVQAGSSSPFSHVEVSRPSAIFMLVYFSALLLFIFWQHIKSRKALIMVIIFLLNTAVYTNLQAKSNLKLLFFDVGQGDSALVTFPNGKNMLIDAGDQTEHIDYGERVILPFLKRNGIDRIDNILITHNHSDHVGGVAVLLEKLNVGRVLKSTFQDTSYFETLVDSVAKMNDIPVKRLMQGDTLLIDKNVLILVLHPSRRFLKAFNGTINLNNTSVVIKMHYGTTSFLFTGDAEVEAEEAMSHFGPLLQSDVLKVGHHGSATSSSETFRHLVNASTGIVSVKKYNRFGLPSEATIAAYKKDGVSVYRIDETGAIQLESNGNKVRRING